MESSSGSFPRWTFYAYRAATETILSLPTSSGMSPIQVGNSGGGGGEDSSQTSTVVIETAVRVSAESTATTSGSTCESDPRNTSKNGVEVKVGNRAEFQNNWLAPTVCAASTEESDQSALPRELVLRPGCVASSSNGGGVTKRRHLVQQQPPPQPPPPPVALKCGDATLARPSSASNSSWDQQQHQHEQYRRTNNSFPAWQRRQRHPSSSNASNMGADDLAAAAAAARPQSTAALGPAAADVNPRKEEQACCLATVTPLRVLGLMTYYLLLWALTGAFTWLLLEVSLMTTGSRGKYPYYMAPHSFILTSPQIGFLYGDRNPGEAAEFASLPVLLAKVETALATVKTGDSDARNCAGATATDEETLARPCNLTTFAEVALTKARLILNDRPMAIVHLKRHLGYLPASGNVTVTCSASAGGAAVPLRYFSWSGTHLLESTSSGSVSADYFPMMSKRHRVPWVLVSLDTSVNTVWVGLQVTFRCGASDGGPRRPERELLLLVKAGP